MPADKKTNLSDLRVVFFGTPDFAVPVLEALIKNSNVCGVVTQPDKPQGRSQQLVEPPVKKAAGIADIPVFQPSSLKRSLPAGQQFLKTFKALKPDLAVVVAYGNIIPPDILDIPQNGFINVHGSLLPKLRGASPIQFAILEGFKKTGITIMLMDEGMDTGPTLSSQEIALAVDETAETLHDKLKELGADLLISTLNRYLSGKIKPQPQDNTAATYSQIIKKTDGKIDWSKPPKDIYQLIRAFTPWPGAYTFVGPDKLRIQILTARLNSASQIEITQIKPAGKSAMTYQDYLNGYPDFPLPPQ